MGAGSKSSNPKYWFAPATAITDDLAAMQTGPKPPRPPPDFADAIVRATNEANQGPTGRTRKSTFLGGL